jgi:hypothetical protein
MNNWLNGYYERRKLWRNSKAYRVHEHTISKIAECKRKGIECDLKSEEDLDWPDVCPILKIPLRYEFSGKRGVKFNSPAIDRIDPSKGYLKDNVWVISHKANTMKHNASLNELKQFANWVSTL